MIEQTTPKIPKTPEQAPEKTPIGRLTLPEVNAALADCERTTKLHSDTVKAKLGANAQKGRLMTRRIALLIDAGDAAVMDLLDKLMKVKLSRSA